MTNLFTQFPKFSWIDLTVKTCIGAGLGALSVGAPLVGGVIGLVQSLATPLIYQIGYRFASLDRNSFNVYKGNVKAILGDLARGVSYLTAIAALAVFNIISIPVAGVLGAVTLLVLLGRLSYISSGNFQKDSTSYRPTTLGDARVLN